MIQDNPIFNKESLDKAISALDGAAYTLIYDSNNLPEQYKAGKELQQAKWIFAHIIDHIFDYYPYTYYMNSDEQREFPEFIDWFIRYPSIGVKNAISYVQNNFSVLETVTRDELNQYRVPYRKLDEEAHINKVLQAIEENIDEINLLLHAPKKIADPEKPSEQLIRQLIEALQTHKKNYWKHYEQNLDKDLVGHTIQMTNMIELFINPLLLAWGKYNYGGHSDFWEEGDSMINYMMFEMKANETIQDLIKILQTSSPFALFERNSIITNNLIKVYTHLLKSL